jgi:diguanylate cyclase (GGDEF)-like protein
MLQPKADPALRRPTGIWIIKALAVAVAIGVAAFCSVVLLGARQDAETQAVTAASNLTRTIAKGIGKDFEFYNQSLDDIASDLQDPALQKADPAVRRKAIFHQLAKSTYIDDVFVLDKRGQFVEDAHGFPWSTKTFSGRSFFLDQRRSSELGLSISGPILSPVEGDDWVLMLSRRISGPSGEFEGVVAATLSLGYFENLFDNLKAASTDTFAILDDKGVMILREPFRMANMGGTLASLKLIKEISSQSSIIDERVARTDGVRRVYSLSQVHNLPLIVSVGLAKDDLFSAWRRKADMIGVMTAGLLAAMAGLAWLLARELTRRQAAENELKALAAKLFVAAKTDGLTGLANRREFDELSEREWKRAIREQATLSLLVIDVDHFKIYNDRYGHQQGDHALVAVAACIRTQLKRPLDVAARYGGEEFAALLPNTDLGGAWELAEAIRRSVMHQRAGAEGSLTVSVGVAAFAPEVGDLFCDAFAKADAALYRAKELGRNRTFFAADSQRAAETAAPLAQSLLLQPSTLLAK